VVGSDPRRPTEALCQSSTGVRTPGHSDQTFRGHGQAQAGLLAGYPVEASVGHQAGLSVRLLWVDEVLSAAFVAAVLEAEAPEEVVAEDTGKDKG
jgi:hypothetical protein